MEEVKNYLQDIEEEIVLTPVSAGIRFVDYIIDVIAYYTLNFIVGVVMVVFGPLVTPAEPGTSGYEFFFFGIAIALYFLYYFVMEGATKGKTIGKLITGTRAVTIEGRAISWKDAAKRSLIRLVPFEPFSAFGGFPWHDTWTQTITIKNRK